MVNILGCHANEWALLNSVVVIVSMAHKRVLLRLLNYRNRLMHVSKISGIILSI